MLTLAAPLTSTATPSTPAVSNVLINPSLIGSKNILITTNMASQNSGGDSLKRKHEDDDDYDAVWWGSKLLPHPAVSTDWCRSRPVRICGASFLSKRSHFTKKPKPPAHRGQNCTENLIRGRNPLCCFCLKEHSTKMNKNLVCLDSHLQVIDDFIVMCCYHWSPTLWSFCNSPYEYTLSCKSFTETFFMY